VKPVQSKTKELLGYGKGRNVPTGVFSETWVGISTDEVTRMKPSGKNWIENRWPLIERRMSRKGCLDWLKNHDYPLPPKSSCLGCPFRSYDQFDEMRKNSPEEWEDTIYIDNLIRDRVEGKRQYLYRKMIPLQEIPDYPDDSTQLDFFQNECEGMCGV
jgi:hypothetical protein